MAHRLDPPHDRVTLSAVEQRVIAELEQALEAVEASAADEVETSTAEPRRRLRERWRVRRRR